MTGLDDFGCARRRFSLEGTRWTFSVSAFAFCAAIVGCDAGSNSGSSSAAETSSAAAQPNAAEKETSASQEAKSPAAAAAKPEATTADTKPAKRGGARRLTWPGYKPVELAAFPAIEPGTKEDRFQKLGELAGHQSAVEKILVTTDAKRAVTRDVEGNVLLWNLPERRLQLRMDLGDRGQPGAMAIAPDGKLMLIAFASGPPTKWDLETGQYIGALQGYARNSIVAIEFSSDSRLVAMIVLRSSNGSTGNLEVYDMQEDGVIFGPPSYGRVESVRYNSDLSRNHEGGERRVDRWQIAWSRNGTTLAVSNGYQPFVFDIALPRRPGNSPDNRNAAHRLAERTLLQAPFPSELKYLRITDILLSSDGADGIFGLEDGQLYNVGLNARQYGEGAAEANEVQPKREILRSRSSRIRDLAVFPGATHFASYQGGESIDVWTLGSDNSYVRTSGGEEGVRSAAICPDGRHALSGYEDGKLVLYQLPRPVVATQDFDRLKLLEPQVRPALLEGRYAELDKLGEELRAAKKITWVGTNEYWHYYDWLRFPDESTELGWTKHLQRLRSWVEASPESPFAKIALAYSLDRYGWVARGGGYIGDVTEQGHGQFRERLTEAAKFLVDAQRIAPDDAALYHAQIMVGQGLGIGKERLRRIFDKGFAANANYYPLYTSMAFCLLPRWYGEPQDVGNFLDEVSTKLGNDEGLAVYAMVAGGLRQSHRSTSELSLLGIDMKKVNAGGSVLARRYPFANQFLNLACWAASEQRDRPRARDLFGWIGPNPDSTYWGDEQVFQRIRAWATENDTSRQQEQCILASFFGLESIAFSPDGKRLAVGGIEALRQLTIWDVESGKELIVLPHPAPIHSLEYSPDGKLLAVAGGDGSNAQLVVWNFGDNEPDPTVLMGPEGELRAVTFSPDGKQLAAGGQDDHVWIWDTSKWNRSPEKIAWKSRVRLPDGIPDADELRRLLPTQETTIGDLRFSPDGRYLAILGGRTLLSLDRTNATPGSVFLYRNGLPYRLGRFGEELLIGGSPNFVERTAFSDVSPRNFYSLLSNDGNPVVTSVDASADGSLVAAGLHLPGRLSGEVGGGAVSIYDPRGRFGKVVTLLEGHNDRVGDIKFSPDGKRLASAGWDGTLRIWRVPPLPAIEEATAGKNASTAIGRGRSGPSANVGNDGTSGR